MSPLYWRLYSSKLLWLQPHSIHFWNSLTWDSMPWDHTNLLFLHPGFLNCLFLCLLQRQRGCSHTSSPVSVKAFSHTRCGYFGPDRSLQQSWWYWRLLQRNGRDVPLWVWWKDDLKEDRTLAGLFPLCKNPSRIRVISSWRSSSFSSCSVIKDV